MKQEFADLPLGTIVASTTNPRKTFHPERMAELAESIKATGVHTPVLVRPLPASRVQDTADLSPRPTFELVTGERRFRASQMAGRPSIPAMVRALTDDQVLEIQIIENLQRDDLLPLEEAEGYEHLMQRHDPRLTADEVASRIGKSRSYVYSRLKLLDLGPEGREALRTGKIDASRALLIARIPDTKLQRDALGNLFDWQGEALSYREAAEMLQRQYMLRLAEARFKITDETLVPDAGSCRTCSKRTGANPDLFADVKGADVCTDPPCFKAKEAAHQERQLKAAREAGATIIEGREAKALVPHSWNTRIDGFLRLDEKEDSPGDKPLRALIGKLMEQEGITATLVANPHKDGDLIAVIDHSTAQRLLAKKGMQEQAELVEAKAQESEKAAKKAQQAKDREKFENAWRWAVLQAAWAKIDAMEDGMYSVPDTLIRKLAIRHMPNSQDKSKRLAKLLGVPAEIQPTLALRDWIEHHPDPDRALALVMMFEDIEWQSWKPEIEQGNPTLIGLATDTGVEVDVEAVKKEIKAEHTAAIKARNKAQEAKSGEAPEGSSPLTSAAHADGVRGEQSKKGSGKGGASGGVKGGKGKKAPAAPAAARLSEDEARTGIAAAMQGDGVGAGDGPEGSDPAVGDAAGGVDGRATSPDAGAAQPVPGARVRLVGETMTGRLGRLIERSTFHSMDKRFSGEPVTSWLVRIDGLTAEYIFELNEFEVISEEGAEA